MFVLQNIFASSGKVPRRKRFYEPWLLRAPEIEIEKLLQKRRIRRGRGWSTQYLVRWMTYGPEDDTWETEHELRRHANEIVDAYERTNNQTVGLPRHHQDNIAVVVPLRHA